LCADGIGHSRPRDYPTAKSIRNFGPSYPAGGFEHPSTPNGKSGG
jgi:hypothetical protein